MRVRTGDSRTLTVVPNGSVAVRITDHPQGDRVHSGHSMDFNRAGQLAEALRTAGNITVGTREGGNLVLSGHRLGELLEFREMGRGVNPAVANAPRGPWVLDEDQRVALADALEAAIGG